MNQQQIDCFLNVATYKSYTKAAQHMFLSQPTLSRYIKTLEKELNCLLFKRTTQKVDLTQAGQEYYYLFSKWQIELQKTKDYIGQLHHIAHSKIRMGYLEGWYISSFFSKFYKEFTQKYPEIEIELFCFGMGELINELHQKRLDVVLIIDNSYLKSPKLEYKQVTELNKGILYSRYHPMSKKKNLNPRDFENSVFYTIPYAEEHYVEIRTKEYCAIYDFVPKTQPVANIESIIANVHNGNGVMITDEWGPGTYQEGLYTFPINAKGEIFLVWNRGHNDKAIELLVEEFYVDK